jgi:hypothetical protein
MSKTVLRVFVVFNNVRIRLPQVHFREPEKEEGEEDIDVNSDAIAECNLFIILVCKFRYVLALRNLTDG